MTHSTGLKTATTLLTSLITATAALTACASSSAPDPTQAASRVGPPASSPAPPGSDPATWAPVEITPDMNGQTVRMAPNQRAVFTGLPADGRYEITTNPESASVVAPTMPTDGGWSATDTFGFTALATGVANVTVMDVSASGDPQPVVTVIVDVTLSGPSGGMAGGDPATWAPVEVTPGMNGQTVQVKPGQTGLFQGLESAGLVFVQSTDLTVVMPLQPAGDGTVQKAAGFQAITVGTATVTVTAANIIAGEADPLVTIEVEVTP